MTHVHGMTCSPSRAASDPSVERLPDQMHQGVRFRLQHADSCKTVCCWRARLPVPWQIHPNLE